MDAGPGWRFVSIILHSCRHHLFLLVVNVVYASSTPSG